MTAAYSFQELIDITQTVIAAFDAAEQRPWTIEATMIELMKQVGDLSKHVMMAEGRVFFIDSLYSETSTASDHRLEGQEATTLTRRLNDGQEFRIVKVFYQPAKLAAQLEALGWQTQMQTTAHYFLYGFARRRP